MFLKKLKERILSLEMNLGFVFTEDHGYANHEETARGYISRIEKRLSELEEKINSQK